MLELGTELMAVPTPGHYPVLLLGADSLSFMGKGKPIWDAHLLKSSTSQEVLASKG